MELAPDGVLRPARLVRIEFAVEGWRATLMAAPKDAAPPLTLAAYASEIFSPEVVAVEIRWHMLRVLALGFATAIAAMTAALSDDAPFATPPCQVPDIR